MPKIEVEIADNLFSFIEAGAKVNEMETAEFLSLLLNNFLKGFLKGLTVAVTPEQIKSLPYGM